MVRFFEILYKIRVGGPVCYPQCKNLPLPVKVRCVVRKFMGSKLKFNA